MQVLNSEDLLGLRHDVLVTSDDALQAGRCEREQKRVN